MTDPTRVERARAEIQQQRDETLEPWHTELGAQLINDLLDIAAATLDRHLPESWDGPDFCCVCSSLGSVIAVWPCQDAAAVLDLFAPDTPTPPSTV